MTKDLLLWDETLFKDRDLFELDHVPEHFSHRASQMNSLKYCVRPAMHGARPVNALCLGPPGTGKTTAIFKLFEEIEAHTGSVVPTYVNCQMDYTRYGVLHRIYRKLLKRDPPTSGISFKRIFERVMTEAAAQQKVLLVALDDFNYLFHEREVDHVLYSLLRAHETCPGVRVGIIAVLSEPALKYVFDPRVVSVFQPEEISFPLYTISEIREILSRRTQLGFYPGVISGDVLDTVAEKAETTGDLRVGIDLLKRAGMAAERRSARAISLEDVESSFERSRLVHLSYALKSLKKDELLVLRLAAGKKSSQAGDLFRAFHDETGAGYTRFHEILNKLDSIRLIDTDYAGTASKGRSRTVRIRYDPEEVLSRIMQQIDIADRA